MRFWPFGKRKQTGVSSRSVTPSPEARKRADEFLQKFLSEKQSFETVLARTTSNFARLPREVIETTADEKLIDLVYYFVSTPMSGLSSEERYRHVMSLPAGIRRYYAMHIHELEVFNGGLNQFFWNSSGQYAAEVLEGFKMIGADRHAALMERAIDIMKVAEAGIKEGHDVRSGGELIDNYVEYAKGGIFEQIEAEWDALDQGGSRPLEKLQVKYLREHPEQFVVG